MQNATPSEETSEELGSRIPGTSPQRDPQPGVAPAGTIERAAQRLDWTIAFGVRHNTPRGLEETTNQQRRPDPPLIARASWLRSGRAGGSRLLLISGLCVASALVATTAGICVFLLTHSATEKAIAESALVMEPPAKASQTASLIRGLAMISSAASTARSAALSGPAPTPAPTAWETQLNLGLPFSSPGFARAPRDQPTVPTFSAAEIAGLLARGDWLFATGNVASARLIYERAADAGEARAALRLGETFDPVYLDHSRLRGLHGDPSMAALWYRRARDLSAVGAASRLKGLEAKEGRN